nr:putative ubiquitin carboxyl-terminal hydrolase 3 [Quercus suber]
MERLRTSTSTTVHASPTAYAPCDRTLAPAVGSAIYSPCADADPGGASFTSTYSKGRTGYRRGSCSTSITCPDPTTDARLATTLTRADYSKPLVSAFRDSHAVLSQSEFAYGGVGVQVLVLTSRQLPWYSTEEGSAAFPARATPSRKRRQNLVQPTDVVALPARIASEDQRQSHAPASDELKSEVSTAAAPSEQTEPETPATSQAPSENDFTRVSTPATPAQTVAVSPKLTPTLPHSRRDTRSAIAVPNISVLNKPKTSSPSPAGIKQEVPNSSSQSIETARFSEDSEAATDAATETSGESGEIKPSSKQTAPKSWADLVRSQSAATTRTIQTNSGATSQNAALPKGASLADALKQYDVLTDLTLSFIEPRGLVNTGNMCYMNSVRQRTVHSMKSETPLVDAMIMFMREFKVLASAESVDILRKGLKQEQLEQYGDPVTPEYVYDAIRKLPRFQSMRVSRLEYPPLS